MEVWPKYYVSFTLLVETNCQQLCQSNKISQIVHTVHIVGGGGKGCQVTADLSLRGCRVFKARKIQRCCLPPYHNSGIFWRSFLLLTNHTTFLYLSLSLVSPPALLQQLEKLWPSCMVPTKLCPLHSGEPPRTYGEKIHFPLYPLSAAFPFPVLWADLYPHLSHQSINLTGNLG